MKYRVWIWYKLWPLIFKNYFGMRLRDTVTVNCVNSVHNDFSYLQQLTNVRDTLIERDYKSLDTLIENNKVGVDEVLDPISMQRGIHYSVLIDDTYLVNYFYEKGANLMIRDSKGYTALLKACCLGRLDVIKVLLENGVPLDHRDPDNLNCMDLAKKMDKLHVVDYINSLPNKKLNQEKIDFWLNQPLKEYYNTRVWWVKSLY
jgi:ankyrin repeat protein